MPSPFPGMDPYLEERNLWLDVHHRLITAIGDALSPQVAPHYIVRIEQRTYEVQVSDPEAARRPDAAILTVSRSIDRPAGVAVAGVAVGAAEPITLPQFEEVREAYLEIRAPRTREVITAIEVLSRTNKMAPEGRREYEIKRNQVLKGMTNLVEIDLLRTGIPMEMFPAPASDYRVMVSRGWERPHGWLYRIGLRDALPEVSVPLREGEEEARLPLGTLLSAVYDRARYDLDVDYRDAPPPPPLSDEDIAWVDELLRSRGLRDASPGAGDQ